MPVPIKLLVDNKNDKTKGFLETIDLSILNNYGSPLYPEKKKSTLVSASNDDASVLYDLWKSKEDNFASTEGFDKIDITRLKSKGFIQGGADKVEFTKKGRIVITTIVLSEPNQFSSKKQEKPYNEILANMKKKKKSTTAKTAGVYDAGNESSGLLSSEKPDKNSNYVYDQYLMFSGITKKGTKSNKEYSVRIYLQDGGFVVWGLRGKIGYNLVWEFKGKWPDYSSAMTKVQSVVSEKQKKYHSPANSKWKPDEYKHKKPGSYMNINDVTDEVLESTKKGKAIKTPNGTKAVEKPTAPSMKAKKQEQLDEDKKKKAIEEQKKIIEEQKKLQQIAYEKKLAEQLAKKEKMEKEKLQQKEQALKDQQSYVNDLMSELGDDDLDDDEDFWG